MTTTTLLISDFYERGIGKLQIPTCNAILIAKCDTKFMNATLSGDYNMGMMEQRCRVVACSVEEIHPSSGTDKATKLDKHR